ncbi:MAG: sigma-70 family RNA polymerase sigma factor [Candidatus Eisenbacteria bacterium]|nr:sigma-70 family RNA polymerase sigma factor [Candidatus Eisenbacteria bacterium]
MGEPRLHAMTDEELVAMSQDGDVQAFNMLAQRWEGSLYQYVRRSVGNPDEARDLCQEALTKAYQNIERLRDGDKFKSWVHHIALNLCRDRFRTQKARTELRSLDDVTVDELELASSEGRLESPDTTAVRGQLADLMAESLSLLPPDQKNAIMLREYHGFTSQEIAEITGVPSATVRTRIFYGLKSLRRALEERGVTSDAF